jgi:hypothetical protein
MIVKCNGFEVGKTYRIKNCFYEGQIVRLLWISNTKSIMDQIKARRQIQCEVVESKVKFNTVINNLVELEKEEIKNTVIKNIKSKI